MPLTRRWPTGQSRFNLNELAEKADSEGNGHKFWFRCHYRLPPTDPRYLSMTDEDIIYEYECWLVYNGEAIKTCPQCETKTHKTGCITCKNQDGEPLSLTGDDVMDDIISKI